MLLTPSILTLLAVSALLAGAQPCTNLPGWLRGKVVAGIDLVNWDPLPLDSADAPSNAVLQWTCGQHHTWYVLHWQCSILLPVPSTLMLLDNFDRGEQDGRLHGRDVRPAGSSAQHHCVIRQRDGRDLLCLQLLCGHVGGAQRNHSMRSHAACFLARPDRPLSAVRRRRCTTRPQPARLFSGLQKLRVACDTGDGEGQLDAPACPAVDGHVHMLLLLFVPLCSRVTAYQVELLPSSLANVTNAFQLDDEAKVVYDGFIGDSYVFNASSRAGYQKFAELVRG